MDLALMLSFLLAAILLTIMPGPDNLYVLTESISKGAKQGVLISIGLITGVLVHTFLAAFGLSIIFKQSAWAYNALCITGAAYLLYLAYGASREKPIALEMSSDSASQEAFFLVRKGFFMNVLNPKVSLFFIALLPQFVNPEAVLPIWGQMVVLGLIFMAQGLLIFSLISILAGTLTSYVQKPVFWSITKWLKIGILIAIALGLLLSMRS
ncbi:LysE family translocator [Luteibaculum oceani]|uniref:LysE family translocator n=1 Tax=Luteibaculum oceani TaxID=1294296 RepID=A0A5C6VJU0_9FLAO|nr:LysE family translocator [Luteibaculum oceani]TXC85260.1 LysE family translocator [Luteibaculum oceani]